VVRADTKVERALVVVAHPDDVDFWAGGTVAGWTSTGIAVIYCVLSDGDSGGFDPNVPGQPSQASAEPSRRPRRLCWVWLMCDFWLPGRLHRAQLSAAPRYNYGGGQGV
jgi:hypothetical protein